MNHSEFEAMRRAFEAAPPAARAYGLTLLELVEQMRALVDNGPGISGAELREDGLLLPTEPFPGMTRRKTLELVLLSHALRLFDGDITKACKWCGVSRPAYYRLEKLNKQRPSNPFKTKTE